MLIKHLTNLLTEKFKKHLQNLNDMKLETTNLQTQIEHLKKKTLT